MRYLAFNDAYFGALIFGGTVFYSIHSVYQVSSIFNTISFPNIDFFFNNGWSFINRKFDIVDHEWEYGKIFLLSAAPWLFFHAVISVLLHHKNCIHFLAIFHFIFTSCYIISNFNLKCFILIIIQPTIFEILTKIFTITKKVIWICALMNVLIFLNFNIKIVYDYFHQLGMTDYQIHMLYIALYWINTRCVCYYIDYTEKRTKSNFVGALSYCLYLPLLFLGPFIQYEDFKKCCEINNKPLKLRLKTFIKNLIRFIFWWIFTDISLHYIYVNVISYIPEVVQRFDSVTLYGFGYCMGQYFHLKYIVFYGLATTFAQFDGIPIPNRPKCIGRIHLYSDMWKYFDNGLYQFLLKYIYIPVINMTSNPFYSNIICFIFIFIWHGFMRMDIFIWVLLNCIGVMLERVFNTIYTFHLRKYTEKYLNQFWERHLGCMINAPLLMMSAISNFYFFAGVKIGNIFVQRVFEDKLSSTLTLLFVLYGCGLFSIHVKKIEMEKKKLRNKIS